MLSVRYSGKLGHYLEAGTFLHLSLRFTMYSIREVNMKQVVDVALKQFKMDAAADMLKLLAKAAGESVGPCVGQLGTGEYVFDTIPSHVHASAWQHLCDCLMRTSGNAETFMLNTVKYDSVIGKDNLLDAIPGEAVTCIVRTGRKYPSVCSTSRPPVDTNIQTVVLYRFGNSYLLATSYVGVQAAMDVAEATALYDKAKRNYMDVCSDGDPLLIKTFDAEMERTFVQCNKSIEFWFKHVLAVTAITE